MASKTFTGSSTTSTCTDSWYPTSPLTCTASPRLPPGPATSAAITLAASRSLRGTLHHARALGPAGHRAVVQLEHDALDLGLPVHRDGHLGIGSPGRPEQQLDRDLLRRAR